MIVDRAQYRQGMRVDSDASTVGGSGDTFVWVGLYRPTQEEFTAIAAEFDLHPLAVEDAVKAHQRPKLEHYGRTWFLVLKTIGFADDTDDVTVGEVMAFVGDGFIVTVRHADTRIVADLRTKLESRPERLANGPWEVLHHLCDDVVDEYETVVQNIDAAINEVQQTVFAQPTAAHAGQIFHLKRQVLEFRQAVLPLAEALERLAISERSPVSPDRRVYFRDVYDHTRRVADRLHTLDDLLTSALDVNVSQVGMRQNEDMRKISAWVAIVAVPTMVAGMYGMNFENMPELQLAVQLPDRRRRHHGPVRASVSQLQATRLALTRRHPAVNATRGRGAGRAH